MTPRRSTYKPPRPRREIVIAVAASGALAVLTGLLVWAVGPHASSTTPSAPTLTAPPTVATPAPSTPASSTPSTPASSTPSTPPSS
jgi:hypothetical protein